MKLFLACIFLIFISISNAQTNNSVQSEILNYTSARVILAFEKLEIGIKLPNTLENQVSNFTKKIKGTQINPYLEWELKVTVEFIHPLLKKSVFVDGFYTKDYTSTMKAVLPEPKNKISYSNEEYKALSSYTEQETDYNFRVRFSPFKEGGWQYRVHIKTKDATFKSELSSFNVTKGTNKGFLSIGENKRYFELDNKSFYPIGGNAPWPATYPETDPVFASKSQYEGVPFPEDYRKTTVAPRVYEVYKELLSNMSDNGANMVRMIMYPSATDIEWENIGDYTERLKLAGELDDILTLAEKKGIYLLWNLQIHYSFQESNEAYYKDWTWDKKIDGKSFCYKDLIKSENPIDFFSNEEAKKFYKQKLRYIISRWGYSTNVGLFELFSEINNVVEPGTNNSLFYKTGNNWQLYCEWQQEMALYIKSHHNGRIHLVTASFAGDKRPEDTVFVGKPMDVLSTNNYDIHAPSYGDFWVKSVSKRHLNEAETDCYVKPKGYDIRDVKPLIYSETGVLAFSKNCDYTTLEIDRHLYQSIFSGVAGAFDWDYWFLKDLSSYPKAKTFISNIEFDKDLWHPGASKIKKVINEVPSWNYQENYASKMEGKNGLADLSYLRNGNKTEAIGVLSNKTYNFYTITDCFDQEWDKNVIEKGWDKPIKVLRRVKTSGRKSEKLKLKGMKSSQYVIDYFLPSDLVNPIHTSYDRGPSVKIETTLGDTKAEYLLLFKAREK